MAILVIGSLAVMVKAVRMYLAGQRGPVYEKARQGIGRAVLLGLEILIIADIIQTVIVDPDGRVRGHPGPHRAGAHHPQLLARDRAAGPTALADGRCGGRTGGRCGRHRERGDTRLTSVPPRPRCRANRPTGGPVSSARRARWPRTASLRRRTRPGTPGSRGWPTRRTGRHTRGWRAGSGLPG